MKSRTLTARDYQALAEFRYQIRRFLQFSEQAALAAGLNPSQHQLLLTLKGLPEGVEPTIGELAERLHLRPHSTVELVDRLAGSGYVRRRRSARDKRQVMVEITAGGEAVLAGLTLIHRHELETAALLLVEPLNRLLGGKLPSGAA